MGAALGWRSDDVRASRPVTSRPLSPLARAGVAVSVLISIVGSVGWTVHRQQVDFLVYLMGARHLASADLYHLYLHGPHLPFTYPPFSTLFFWPLTLVPTGLGAVLWSLVNLGALAVIIAVSLLHVRPDVRDDAPRVPWAVVGMLLGPAVLLEPVMLDLSYGQVNLVLVALVLVDATTIIRVGERTLPRGIGIGLAAAIKLVPLIFVPFLIVTRQYRAARTAVLTAGAGTLAAFLINPSASAAFWSTYVVDQKRIGNVTYVSNQSLEGTLARVAHHAWRTRDMVSVQALVVLAGLALAWWAWRTSSTFLAVLVVGDTGLLASPITWAHHMVWVVAALVWLWWGADRPRWGRRYAVGAAALFYVAPMWLVAHGPRFDSREHGWVLLATSSFTLASLIFLGGVALLLVGRHREPSRRVARLS